MGWFGDDSQPAQAYDQVQSGDNQPSWSHELIAGAASYEAAKAYENHCAKNGQPGSHDEAKEIAAGFAGAFIDREVESRGMNWVDREEAKRHSKRQTDEAVDQNYGNQQGY